MICQNRFQTASSQEIAVKWCKRIPSSCRNGVWLNALTYDYQGRLVSKMCKFFETVSNFVFELTYIIFQYIGFENAIKAEMLTLTALLETVSNFVFKLT